MPRNNFLIDVINKEGTILMLAVYIIRASQEEFYKAKNFALQLLYNDDTEERADLIKRSALGKAVKPEDLYNKKWLVLNQSRFIKSIEMIEQKNFPVPNAVRDNEENKAFWSDKNKIPLTIYKIEVTDEKWIEHIKINDSWFSASVDYFL